MCMLATTHTGRVAPFTGEETEAKRELTQITLQQMAALGLEPGSRHCKPVFNSFIDSIASY